MITSWDLYWITRLDGINTLLTIFFIVGTIVLIVAAACYCAAEEKKPAWALKPVIVIIIIGILATFIPDTKTMVAIVFVPKIVNNETVQQIPENAAKFINLKLKEWISDLDNTKTEKEKSK